MTVDRVEALASLAVAGETAAALNLPSGRLLLERAWPRRPGHLLLEYRDGDALLPGQWVGDGHRLRRLGRALGRSAPGRVAVLGDRGLVLQAGGADERLPCLPALAGRPGAELVVHQPGRRAVVRLAGPPVRWVKLLRPGAVAGVRTAAAVAGAVPGLTTPRLLRADEATGRTVWTSLAGEPLHLLLGEDATAAAARRVGAAVRALHDTALPAGLPVHGPQDERRVLDGWLARRGWHAGPLPAEVPALAERVGRRLCAEPAEPVLIHRDLHDKQLTVTADGGVGLLDLDTLAVGEAALDLGNLLAHLELRALQGRCTPGQAGDLAAALVDGYRPSAQVRRRLPAYLAASRLRLWCVYAFRPRWRPLLDTLLARVEA
jgi:aminoglycoside phosphotransferase (APT) family kinase protein